MSERPMDGGVHLPLLYGPSEVSEHEVLDMRVIYGCGRRLWPFLERQERVNKACTAEPYAWNISRLGPNSY